MIIFGFVCLLPELCGLLSVAYSYTKRAPDGANTYHGKGFCRSEIHFKKVLSKTLNFILILFCG